MNEEKITLKQVVHHLEDLSTAKNLTKSQKKIVSEIKNFLYLFECPSCRCLLGYDSNREEWNKKYVEQWTSSLQSDFRKKMEGLKLPEFAKPEELHLDFLFNNSQSIKERIEENDKLDI